MKAKSFALWVAVCLSVFFTFSENSKAQSFQLTEFGPLPGPDSPHPRDQQSKPGRRLLAQGRHRSNHFFTAATEDRRGFSLKCRVPRHELSRVMRKAI